MKHRGLALVEPKPAAPAPVPSAKRSKVPHPFAVTEMIVKLQRTGEVLRHLVAAPTESGFVDLNVMARRGAW